MLIAAISEDDDSKIIYGSEISGSNPIPKYDIIISEGEPFSLVEHNSTYLWIVGRVVDAINNLEQAFYHTLINRLDGNL